MKNLSTEELEAEVRHLRDLVVSLSVTLLRKVALDQHKARLAPTTSNAERLIREADECFRCAKLPSLKSEIAEGLNVAGNELMAKAVAIESKLQKMKREK